MTPPGSTVEGSEIMPGDVDQILAQLTGLEARLEARLGRVEAKVDDLSHVTERVAVLERQDQVDRDVSSRVQSRLDALEAERRALAQVEHLRERVSELQASQGELRAALATKAEAESVAELQTTVATKASTETLDAEATRITALETGNATQEGISKGVAIVWTAFTALPGLVGMGLGLWAAFGR